MENKLLKDYLEKIEKFLEKKYYISYSLITKRENEIKNLITFQDFNFKNLLRVTKLLLIIRKVYFLEFFNFDKMITNEIGNYCINYFKEKNSFSYGLFFLTNYLEKYGKNINYLKKLCKIKEQNIGKIEIEVMPNFNNFINEIQKELKDFNYNFFYFKKCNNNFSKLNKYFNK